MGEGYKEWVTTVDGGWEWGEGYSQGAGGVTIQWVGVGGTVQSRSG